MSESYAELSSLGTNLHELAGRISELAKQPQGDEVFATDLYEVERALINADRRMQKLLATEYKQPIVLED